MLTLVFGGAFDPPHTEHINLVRAAVRELGAERAVIVPTFMPPHKCAGMLGFADRAELCRLCFSDTGAETVVDDIEFRRGGDNYACEVLPELKKKYGDIIYLIGGDSLRYFDTWRSPEKILALCPVAAAGREGYCGAEKTAAELTAKYGGEIKVLNYVGKDVSSGRVKAALLLGERPDGLTDEEYRYIKRKNLFGCYADTVEKLRGMESAELFAHSKAALYRAVDLNALHNLKQDYDKVFLAALLHDNAKERPSTDGLDVPADSIGTPVLHQFLGAEKARRDFGVKDAAVLDAIRYHTTAKPDMTVLEKLVYVADSTSYDRLYDPIPMLRAECDADFGRGFEAVLRYTYDKVAAKGRGVYPLTEDAVKYYLK